MGQVRVGGRGDKIPNIEISDGEFEEVRYIWGRILFEAGGSKIGNYAIVILRLKN